MRNKLRSSKVVLSVYISSCQNRKLHEETLPLCISLMPCTWIWKQKVSLIIQSNWLFPYTVLLQNFCQTVSLVHAQKKGQQHNLSSGKQSTQSTNEKCDVKLTSAQDLVSYGRNSSCSVLQATYRCLNCLLG